MSQRIQTISLWQPWATLMAAGFKEMETRSWSPRGLHPGQPVAIHAAKHWTADERELCQRDPFFRRYLQLSARRGLWDFDAPPLGVVVGIATFETAGSTRRYRYHISEHEMAFGDYGDRRWAWVFRDPRPLTPPIPLRGERGIFTWDAPDDVLPADLRPVIGFGEGSVAASRTLALGAAHEARRLGASPEPVSGTSGAGASPLGTGQTRVVHVRRDEYDAYIGRPMPGFQSLGWGNPFRAGVDGDAIAKYRAWILKQPRLLARLHELRGKRLGCWCAPKGGLPGNLYGRVCHGEVLAALADGQRSSMPGDAVSESENESERQQ